MTEEFSVCICDSMLIFTMKYDLPVHRNFREISNFKWPDLILILIFNQGVDFSCGISSIYSDVYEANQKSCDELRKDTILCVSVQTAWRARVFMWRKYTLGQSNRHKPVCDRAWRFLTMKALISLNALTSWTKMGDPEWSFRPIILLKCVIFNILLNKWEAEGED